MSLRRRGILAAPLLLGGCSGVQSVLNPQSDQAGQIHSDFTRLMVVCGVMYLLVMIFLAWAIVRTRKNKAAPVDGEAPHPLFDRAMAGWCVLIVAGLFVLATGSFLVDAALARSAPQPLNVKMTGYQWWWKIEYPSPDPGDTSKNIVTANELHVPVGRPVHIELQSQDVIHSFWVPNLHGKMDLIPGRTNEIVITPRKVGYYRGQCAEFCGLEHAKMALQVFVDTPERFAAWRNEQATSPSTPPQGNAALGAEIFNHGACSNCHRVAGTDAGGVTAPDLTHLASRATIASGTAPRTRANLIAWIRDPQQFKPGANMPAVPLTHQQRAAVVDYLETLK